ncbi:hypothetical protein B1748_23665 [Paenibacillus sp. MY03]|uniref:hypothetical protein n=1 Tax=Paenibacillus sp. MY03 TaxID=302980 RepID=UPI000B3C809B|nr:hypothetical protein [Paenibacillus sp. MY03]OUS73008.1 hypothetical protein B1748_23665 [Paenibacillus sp. MY03]
MTREQQGMDKRIEEMRSQYQAGMRISIDMDSTMKLVRDNEFLLEEMDRIQGLLDQANKTVIAMLTEKESKEHHLKMMEEFDSRYRHSEFDFAHLQQEVSRIQVERDKAIAELKRFADRDPYATGSSAKRVLSELGVPHDPLD